MDQWDYIALPKKWGGWGIKDLYIFSRALVANVVWRLITINNISMKIIVRNYIYPLSIIDQVRLQNKYKTNVSTIWKVVLASFNIIGEEIIFSGAKKPHVQTLVEWVKALNFLRNIAFPMKYCPHCLEGAQNLFN